MAKKRRKVAKRKSSKPKKARKKTRKKAKRVISKPPKKIETMTDIEDYYSQQKRKIDNAVKRLERSRLKEYLRLVDEKKALLNEKKKKFEGLMGDLSSHANNVKKQISVTRMRKGKEKHRFDELYGMNEHLKNIEQQVKDIVTSRKALLKKEKDLLSESKKFFKQNAKALRLHGISPAKNIGLILDKKTKILNETALLINKDINGIFKDKRILERITDAQLAKVARANDELKKLDAKHRNLLKRKQSAKAEGFNYRQQLAAIENKRKDIVNKLSKIH